MITLGTELRVDGHRLVALPWWNAAAHLPLLENSYPFRYGMYVSLLAAVIVALWIATTKGRIFSRPYVLPALAVAALVPAVWQSSYPSFEPSHPPRPAFFADGLYKTCVPRNETLAIFPFAGDSILWQAEAGFRFRLASNGLQPTNKKWKPWTSFDADSVVFDLGLSDIGRPTIDRLLAFAALHHVDRVISVVGNGYPSRAQMAKFGPVQEVGGVLVAPACGEKSLTERDLGSYVEKERQRAAPLAAEHRLLHRAQLQSAPAGPRARRPPRGGEARNRRRGPGPHVRCAAGRLQVPRLRNPGHERARGHVPVLRAVTARASAPDLRPRLAATL